MNKKKYDFPIYDSLVENQISKKGFIDKKDYFIKLEKLKSENKLKFYGYLENLKNEVFLDY